MTTGGTQKIMTLKFTVFAVEIMSCVAFKSGDCLLLGIGVGNTENPALGQLISTILPTQISRNQNSLDGKGTRLVISTVQHFVGL